MIDLIANANARLIQMPNYHGQHRLHRFRPKPQFVMDGAEKARQPVRFVALVKELFYLTGIFGQSEAASEAVHSRKRPRRHSRDRTSVHPAAEITAERNITHQLAIDR